MKVKYVRDHKFSVKFTENGPVIKVVRKPVACIVQDKDGNVGVSVCSSGGNYNNGDTFSKARAKKIAMGRLVTGSSVQVPEWKITNIYGQKVKLKDEVNFWVNKFTDSYKALV